jgi:hypothetical protein
MKGGPLEFLLLLFAGWVNRRQLAVIDYLREENRVLHEQLQGRRLRFTDDQRRRLAVRGKALGRKTLRDLGGCTDEYTGKPDAACVQYYFQVTNSCPSCCVPGGSCILTPLQTGGPSGYRVIPLQLRH